MSGSREGGARSDDEGIDVGCACESEPAGSDSSGVAAGSGSVDFDLAIIGSGSAAFAAAIKASELGASVAIVERGTPGGTCVNVGCVPSKALLVAADAYRRATHPLIAGVPAADGPPDLAAIVHAKDRLVASLRQAKYLDLVDEYGFDLIEGTAVFRDPETIEVNGEPLRARHYLIATGASPRVPPIEGLGEVDYLTSTTALELTRLPERLVVIGANAVGLELGQAFLRFGSEVTFVEIAPRIAAFEEPEISEALADALSEEGARLLVGATLRRAHRSLGGPVVLEGDLGGAGGRVEADEILEATGRVPNTEGLGLDRAGVETDDRGFVVVDRHMRTSNQRVWGAGDVVPSPQFVYVAAAEGAVAAENAIAGSACSIDYATVPRVTFTSPQIAAVGLTEEEARRQGHGVVTATLPLSHVPRAIVSGDTRGLVKLVVDSGTDRLLGAHLLAEGAGDVIQAAVYALMAGLTAKEIAVAYHPYLTMAEALKLAAQTLDKDVAKLSCCAA